MDQETEQRKADTVLSTYEWFCMKTNNNDKGLFRQLINHEAWQCTQPHNQHRFLKKYFHYHVSQQRIYIMP